MRVLYLHDYADLSGGAEHQLGKLRAQVEAEGHETRLIASDQPLADPPNFAKARLVPGASGRAQVASQAANLAAYRAVAAEVRDFRPDIVHIRMFLWQLSPLVLAPLSGVPVVYQAAVYKAVCPNGRRLLPDGSACRNAAGIACLREGCLTPQSWAFQMAQRGLLARYKDRIDATVTLSGRMKTEMERCGWPVRAIIPNGVEPRPARPPLKGAPVIGYAGRLDREKGLSVLLDAAARLGDVEGLSLLFCGDGPDRAAVEAEAAALGVRARFLGHLSRGAMEAALDAAWVQAVPSLWEEPFGNVSTEALMRGVPVVASRVGGQVDIVADDCGRLVPPGDPGALADALRPYVTDRDLSERTGAAGRARAQALFADAAVAERYLALYADLTAERHAA